MSALAGGRHVPFRNSKLTLLLQDCLTRGGKNLLVCALSPETANRNESLGTLRFAQMASQVTVSSGQRCSKCGKDAKPGASSSKAGKVSLGADNKAHMAIQATTACEKALRKGSARGVRAGKVCTKATEKASKKPAADENSSPGTSLQPSFAQGGASPSAPVPASPSVFLTAGQVKSRPASPTDPASPASAGFQGKPAEHGSSKWPLGNSALSNSDQPASTQLPDAASSSTLDLKAPSRYPSRGLAVCSRARGRHSLASSSGAFGPARALDQSGLRVRNVTCHAAGIDGRPQPSEVAVN
eukprot:CAMPEP_0172607020 /NCGR_PEP_ID=MMETSP1068-20121228/27233_1 /TAXON_ID=35684 /ORGANISM="Pseudopedinella elastica, Strain CCMP716" /LENGTH=298 /DNA_ID=CAMNT_0013409927 /DNA_START=27 /DNA_END=921 /DNA_ORIENTATION=-